MMFLTQCGIRDGQEGGVARTEFSQDFASGQDEFLFRADVDADRHGRDAKIFRRGVDEKFEPEG